MKRKGITPVIAVVLLLLITVGAVAGAWQTYQKLISGQDQQQKLQAQQKASNTDIAFVSVYEDSSTSSMKMMIKNTGQREIDLAKELEFYIIPPGSQGAMPYSAFTDQNDAWQNNESETCFESSDGILGVGETYKCNTGIDFPNSTQTIGLRVDYASVGSKYWDYSCTAGTSSTTAC